MMQGLEVSVFGLGGVFAVLVLIYIATSVMLVFAKRINAKNAKKRDEVKTVINP